MKLKNKRIDKDTYYYNIALEVSKRSTCLKRQYGCVLVNNDEIIATGYNGSARGEDNCCEIYEECPRKNVPHNSGDYSDCPAIHAEQNAMLSAARKDMLGSIMYLAGSENGETIIAEPCPICKRMMKNAGIKYIIKKKGE